MVAKAPRFNSEALLLGGRGGCMGNLFAARTTGAVLNEATHYIDSHPALTDRAAPTLPLGAVAVEVLVGH